MQVIEARTSTDSIAIFLIRLPQHSCSCIPLVCRLHPREADHSPTHERSNALPAQVFSFMPPPSPPKRRRVLVTLIPSVHQPAAPGVCVCVSV